MTVTEINTLVDAAVTFMSDGNWAAARAKLIAASAGIATRPDTRHGEAELKYDRRAVNELIEQVNREARRVAGAAGSQLTTTPIKYGGIHGYVP